MVVLAKRRACDRLISHLFVIAVQLLPSSPLYLDLQLEHNIRVRGFLVKISPPRSTFAVPVVFNQCCQSYSQDISAHSGTLSLFAHPAAICRFGDGMRCSAFDMFKVVLKIWIKLICYN